MTMMQNILLFLPLCLAICLVSSTIGRDNLRDILRQGFRLFATMSLSIIGICAVVYWVMEFTLNR
ncbi:MAG: hypothetical protein ACI97A_001383 [Planctomycetota bacterium]|jgi:hypothetical protein